MNTRLLLYFILCILIGLSVTIPMIIVFQPVFIKHGKSCYIIFYIALFPFIFTLVSLSLMVGIKQKCINS